MAGFNQNFSELPESIRTAINSPTNVGVFQDGGMVGPGGMPIGPAQGQAANPAGLGSMPGVTSMAPVASAQDLEASLQRVAQQAPEKLAQVRAMMTEAMQTGELTPQELNMMIQLATVAAQDPNMYPQIRAFAIRQGLAGEADIPVQYDQGLVFAILVVARAMQQGQGQAQPPQPISLEAGGKVPTIGSNDGAVPILAHEGEYVIPSEIVARKGTEFFDKLIATKGEGGSSGA
jgi:hypothetical protein